MWTKRERDREWRARRAELRAFFIEDESDDGSGDWEFTEGNATSTSEWQSIEELLTGDGIDEDEILDLIENGESAFPGIWEDEGDQTITGIFTRYLTKDNCLFDGTGKRVTERKREHNRRLIRERTSCFRENDDVIEGEDDLEEHLIGEKESNVDGRAKRSRKNCNLNDTNGTIEYHDCFELESLSADYEKRLKESEKSHQFHRNEEDTFEESFERNRSLFQELPKHIQKERSSFTKAGKLTEENSRDFGKSRLTIQRLEKRDSCSFNSEFVYFGQTNLHHKKENIVTDILNRENAENHHSFYEDETGITRKGSVSSEMVAFRGTKTKRLQKRDSCSFKIELVHFRNTDFHHQKEIITDVQNRENAENHLNGHEDDTGIAEKGSGSRKLVSLRETRTGRLQKRDSSSFKIEFVHFKHTNLHHQNEDIVNIVRTDVLKNEMVENHFSNYDDDSTITEKGSGSCKMRTIRDTGTLDGNNQEIKIALKK